jgi:hypothetical protein
VATTVVAPGLPDIKVGTFTRALSDGAKTKDRIVIRMKSDRKRVFV